MNLYGTKARYERHYLNAVMYLAKGDLTIASRYLDLTLKGMKEQLAWADSDEAMEIKDSMLQIAGVLKDINGCRTDSEEKNGGNKEITANQEEKSFGPKKNEIPEVSFDEVIGLEEVKEHIYDMVINPMRYAKLYEKFAKKTGGGIIMYGPPGNGKTMIAKAIAHETQSAFFSIKFSDLGSKWFGETEANIRMLFENARKEKSAVIFFDEIDAIAPIRNERNVSSRVVAELLAQMDGVTKTEGNLTVIAATNRLQSIDPAILRPGRFDEKIFVPLPDERGRAAMLKMKLKGIPCEKVRYSDIAKKCDGFSGADIELVCEKAKQAVIRSIIGGASEDTCITQKDIVNAISEVKAQREKTIEMTEISRVKTNRTYFKECMEA